MQDPLWRDAPKGSAYDGYLNGEPVLLMRQWNDFVPDAPGYVNKAWRAQPLG